MNEISSTSIHDGDTQYLSTDLTLASIQSILRYHSYRHEHECNIHKLASDSCTSSCTSNTHTNKPTPTEQLQSFQSSNCYKRMKQNIGSIPIQNLQDNSWKWNTRRNASTDPTTNNNNNKKKKDTPAMKSFSLFDLMDKGNHSFLNSSSTGLQIPPNIRDILEETNAHQLLSKCSSVKLEDIILGINTTENEINELGDLLLQQLLLDPIKGDNDDDDESSFLQVHLNWMEECTQHAECHCFSFVLLRNVLLYLHSISSSTTSSTGSSRGSATASTTTTRIMTKEYYTVIVHGLMKMMSVQFPSWNDTSTFQTPWLEIVYLLLLTFQLEHDTKSKDLTDFHKTWIECETGIFENILEKIMACISSFADVLFVCMDTDFIRYLIQTTTDPEKGAHARRILRWIVLQSSVWTFPYPKTEKSTTLCDNNRMLLQSLETLPTIESRLRQRYSTMEHMMKDSPTMFAKSPYATQCIVSLIQPFLLCRLPIEYKDNLCLILHVFESCSKDVTVLDQVLSNIFPKDDQVMLDRDKLKTLFDTLRMNSSDNESQRRDIYVLLEKMLL